MLNPKDHPKGIVTVSSRGNGDYFVIQDAIDSITDATSDKRYSVQVYPGVYEENLVGKNYVSLVGVGDIEDILVKGTSGTLYTAPNTFSTVYNMAWLMEPTANGAKIFDCTSGGSHFLDRTVGRFVSATNGITGKILDATNAFVGYYRSDAYYTMTGSSVGSNTHTPISLDGTSSFLPTDLNYIVSVSDVDDDYVLIDDGGSVQTLMTRVYLTATHDNAAYSGTMVGIRNSAAGLDKSIQISPIYLTGAGSGTGIAVENDSGGGSAEVNSTHNQHNVSGFTNNRQFRCDTGDVINSSNDYQNAADGSVGTGTVNFVTTNVYGSVDITGGGAFTIDDTDVWHALDTLAVGEASLNMDVEAGDSGAITAFADATGGQVTVTSAGHGLVEDEDITITGTTSYNGVFRIANVTTDTFEITDTWVADDATGTWHHGSHMITNQRGAYKISWAFSAAATGANKTFEFAAYKNTSIISGSKITRQFQTAASIGSVSGEAIINLVPGDHLWFAIMNTSDSTNLTISEGAFTITKVS